MLLWEISHIALLAMILSMPFFVYGVCLQHKLWCCIFCLKGNNQLFFFFNYALKGLFFSLPQFLLILLWIFNDPHYKYAKIINCHIEVFLIYFFIIYQICHIILTPILSNLKYGFVFVFDVFSIFATFL